MIRKQNLFRARTSGYYNYRIPGITVTPDGSLLAWCEARKGTGGDHDPIDILMRRSTDGGETWSERYCVADHRGFPEQTMNNFVCIPDTVEGSVHALFCNLYHRAYYIVSRDDGQTWSAPLEITEVFETFRPQYDWKICAFGPGHGIQLANGRLFTGIWLSTGENFHLPNRAGAIYSDDHGKTWKSAGLIPDTYGSNNETTPLELTDGRVMLNIRMHNERYRRLVSTSPDGTGDWSVPTIDDTLVDPICHGSLCRYDANSILFCNPDALSTDLKPWGIVRDRKNLTVRASHDEGKSWSIKRVLEPGPSGYSDLAVLPDKTICCLYEDGMVDAMADPARLTLARFDMKWLKGTLYGSEEEPMVKPSICLYADILGFKEAVKEAEKSQAQQAHVEKLVPVFRLAGMPDPVGLVEESWKFANFSDSFVYGIPCSADSAISALREMLRIAAFFQMQLATLGHFVTGGISHGQLCIHKDITYGKALIDAHDCAENSKTKSGKGRLPRIVLDVSAIELLGKEDANKFLRKDPIDDKYYVDYLRLIDHDDAEMVAHEQFVQHKEAISNIPKECNDTYSWLAEYHNSWHKAISQKHGDVVREHFIHIECPLP